MLLDDLYSQPHAADPVLEARTVLDLVRRHHVHCSAVTTIDETGGEARTYVLDDTIVLKVQRPHRRRPRTSLAKEAFFLQQLTAYPDIVVPNVLGYGQEDPIEYLIMTRMPGVPALTVTLEGPPRNAVLQALGRTLRRLHTLPQVPFYTSTLFPGPRTQEAFVEHTQRNLDAAVQIIVDTPDLWHFDLAPAALATRILTTLAAPVDLVALHSNPGPIHTFIQPDSLAFVGVIDFGDAYIGHPALDWRWPTHADRVTLLRGYASETPLSDTFLPVWQAVLALSDLLMLATRPQTRPQTLARLQELLTTWV